MKCDKCSHDNSEYNIICEKCGAPLKIENNLILQKRYREKGRHIDIEDIENKQIEPDFNQTKKRVSKFVLFFFLLIIITILYFLYNFVLDNKTKRVIDEYNSLMKNSTLAVLYFGNNDELDKMLNSYSENYEFDYLNINTNDISLRKKNVIRKDLNIFNLSSTFVIISNGVPITTITNIKEAEELLKFLQDNYLVPLILDDTDKTITNFKTLIKSEDEILIYLPTGYSDKIEKTDSILEDISNQHDFNYEKIDAYLLSRKQLLKVMSQLGFSEIQNDLLLYIYDGKIVTVISDKATNENEYFHLLTDYGIIDLSNEDYLINISSSKFENLLKAKNKSVFLIGSDNCNYCERVKPILGQIAYQNGISIYYLNSTKDTKKISELIAESGYSAGLASTPFLMIVENNKILDYIIGLSDKTLYIEKLSEVGVIK